MVALIGMDYGFPLAGCHLKGNISAGSARIYHVPGQKYYNETRVNWIKGERWFCSENAAVEAGWRKARW
jgi:hypothetical protein